jgi:hypothetical protein
MDLDRRARQHLNDQNLAVPTEIKPLLDLFIEGAFVRVAYVTSLGAPFWEVRFDNKGQIIGSGKSRMRG